MTNARWQRWLVAWHGLLIVAWVLGFWPRSPALALAGLVAVPLLSRLCMLPQFVLMAWVCRHDATPRLAPVPLLRAWWAESRWAGQVFGWWQPFRERAVADWLPPPTGDASAPRGVVLVHGFLCNRAFWMPWFALLRARGHGFVAVTLEPAFGSIDDYAATIDAAVRRVAEATGRAPLVVGHSMGGLAIRAWLRAQEPAGRAAAFVCWYSNGDNAVYPPAAAMLDGADNRFIAGVAHVEMAFDARVQGDCLALLQAP